jgi:hypothetical protein
MMLALIALHRGESRSHKDVLSSDRAGLLRIELAVDLSLPLTLRRHQSGP